MKPLPEAADLRGFRIQSGPHVEPTSGAVQPVSRDLERDICRAEISYVCLVDPTQAQERREQPLGLFQVVSFDGDVCEPYDGGHVVGVELQCVPEASFRCRLVAPQELHLPELRSQVRLVRLEIDGSLDHPGGLPESLFPGQADRLHQQPDHRRVKVRA